MTEPQELIVVDIEQARRWIIDSFHALYYVGPTVSHWRGVGLDKCPLDLWTYQQILYETRPELIIETGTSYGGSAYFLADMCELNNCGFVVSIDIKTAPRFLHPRIRWVTADSLDTTMIYPSQVRTMVILDSDHSYDHVLKELILFSKFVSPGCYIIVEDTNLSGHPIDVNGPPGPMEAVEEFLKGNDDFEIDASREQFMMTYNPKGYLRRK